MGQQQLLLIVLGVIVVGIAVAAGMGLFSSSKQSSVKDELVNQNLAIGAAAQQYYSKPTSMGGGNQSFLNFGQTQAPLGKMAYTTNGTYAVGSGNATDILITASPKANLNYTWTATTHVQPDTMWTTIQ
jgi:type II secretory pathway pseudopilin PulG